MTDLAAVPLKSLPVQIIQVEGDLLLKRGCIEIQLSGTQYLAGLRFLLGAFRNGATQEEVLAQLVEEQSDILALIELLKTHNLLVPITDSFDQQTGLETPLDVFYWHFDPHSTSIQKRLRSRRIAVLGTNAVSQALCAALKLSGLENITVVAYPTSIGLEAQQCVAPAFGSPSTWFPQAINYEAWIEKVTWSSLDCVVATSDCGGRDLLREWNELAIEKNCQFVPIVLQDVIGYFGPLVIPGETACYECLLSRENGHHDGFKLRRAIERHAFAGQPVAVHPLMASVLGQIAAFELIKHYSAVIPVRHLGTLIEVNLLGAAMTTRKVLKVPRCAVCSTLHIHPSMAIHKDSHQS